MKEQKKIFVKEQKKIFEVLLANTGFLHMFIQTTKQEQKNSEKDNDRDEVKSIVISLRFAWMWCLKFFSHGIIICKAANAGQNMGGEEIELVSTCVSIVPPSNLL